MKYLFNLSSPISIDEGESLLIQAPSDYDRIYWWCDDNEELPRSLYQVGNSLEILKATSDHNREHIIVSCTNMMVQKHPLPFLTRDGRVKKLDLEKGCDTRICDWIDGHMTFDDVHHQLLTQIDDSIPTDKNNQSLLAVENELEDNISENIILEC
ncbi:hypothetical protein I4U23_000008 [Adineta vaga]|nr:hypothetical protein I4U23_000008 [Adineta vaga]